MQPTSTIPRTTEDAGVLEQTRQFFNKARNGVNLSPRPIDKFVFDEIAMLIPKGNENQAALDLGCHWGRLSVLLACSYGRVIGVDFAERAIGSAERRENIEYHCLDLNTAADQLAGFGPVDLIVAVGVFEMIANPAALCRQLARVAKKSCKILVVIPNRASINYLSLRGALWVSRRVLRRKEYIYNNGYSLQLLGECFINAGFKVNATGSVVGLPLYMAGLLPPGLQAVFLKLDRLFLNIAGGSYHWLCCQPEVEE